MSNENSSKNILVVDDSWTTRRFLVNLLELKGYQVSEATNGKEALEKLETLKPDCIFLDVLMPEMDGIQTLKALKEKGFKIPTIMLTADIQATTKAQCIRYGAGQFITKPAKDSEIIKTLESMLKEN